jgi:hypothetical protein
VNCKPVNRYLHIQLPEPPPTAEELTILLPDDFKPTEERYVIAQVVNWADDVRFVDRLTKDVSVLIDKSMIEEIMVNNSQLSMIQDNYIIALLTD